MRKLTRYTNFNDLKSHKKHDTATHIERPINQSELKEFIDILRNNILTIKNDAEIKTVDEK